MKHLCLDYGLKRIGLAVSDEGGLMAFTRAPMHKSSNERFWSEFLRRLEAERPACLVVGLPLYDDGGVSLTTRQVRNFVGSLARRVSLPIYLMEEAYSSAEAESLMREAGRKPDAKSGELDSLAAAKILESFLHLPFDVRERKLWSGLSLQRGLEQTGGGVPEAGS